MRWLALAVLLLAGCAHRYLRITASEMLRCPQDQLKIHESDGTWSRVSGCGRTVHCQQQIWNGPDEWRCQTNEPD